jgi:hypothetical protein
MARGICGTLSTQAQLHCLSLPKEMVARQKCGTIAMIARKDGDMTGKVPTGERLVREESCASGFLVVQK